MRKEERDSQIKKEAIWTVGIYLIYFLWWSYFFIMGTKKEPSEYEFILGFPDWFFYSCIMGFIGVSTLVCLVVKYIFKEVDFDQGGEK